LSWQIFASQLTEVESMLNELSLVQMTSEIFLIHSFINFVITGNFVTAYFMFVFHKMEYLCQINNCHLCQADSTA